MAAKLTMMLLDTEQNKLSKIEVEDELEEYYRLIGCDCIDIVERDCGGTYFDIICDDEALLKDNPQISAIRIDGATRKAESMLFGNLLFCNHTDDGDAASLSETDCKLIKNSAYRVWDADDKEHLVVIIDY